MLCRGHVSVKKGDKTRFFHHISSSHEVHFDMDLLFSLSYINEKDKKNVIENINILMKHNTTITNEEQKTPEDDVDELLETDTEENPSSDNEEINIEEPIVEPEVSIPDAESNSDQDLLSSGILELKPTILELKQVRVELQNTSLETISRLKRKWKKKSKSDERRDPFMEKEENSSSGSTQRNVVKCGQCQTMLPRSKLKFHKAEKHSKDKEQRPALAMDNERENEMPSKAMDKETEKEVECHLCDDKFLMTDINSHLKTIHNTDVNYEAIMEQFNSMESEQRTPKRFKRERSPEPPSQTVEEPLPLLELEYVPEQPPVRRELEKNPKVQIQISNREKVYQKCDTCKRSVEASNMEEHMVMYHIEIGFKCGLCYQIFREKTELTAHITSKHRHEKDLLNNRQEPAFTVSECRVVCPECPLRFITASSCDLHRSVEHAKRGARRSCDK